MSSESSAVVIVSGGAAISPFTTPDAACRKGLPAGNTDSYLRDGLLAAGFDVFTSPATIGPGTADRSDDWQGFGEPPEVLPADVTVNAVGSIDGAGGSLAGFLRLLRSRYGYASFHLVGHSMGGLFSRAAMRELSAADGAPAVRSLTTIGTPWTGAFVADYVIGDLPLSAAGGDPMFERVLAEFEVEARMEGEASDQVTARYLTGPEGWNARQAGLLDDLTVTVIGGDAFPGPAGIGPNDGLVEHVSALAREVPESVLPHRAVHSFPDAHSIFIADQFGLPWEKALTWDPAVLDVVIDGLS